MVVSSETIAKARALLCPPSPKLLISDIRGAGHEYVTLEGEITAVAEIRQVRIRGAPIPLMDLKLSQGGSTIIVTLWREAAMQTVEVGQCVAISHLRIMDNGSFGLKLNSSVYTTVTQIDAAPYDLVAVIVGAELGEDNATILLDTGVELKVPTATWRGTERDFINRLPLTVNLEVDGNVVLSPNVLFGDEDGDIKGEELQEPKGEEPKREEPMGEEPKGEEPKREEPMGEEPKGEEAKEPKGEELEGLAGLEGLNDV
ncbi:uncharacterized protein LOC143133333 [Alosa pseudoharengus]|uniref:uncharacterized protein LOC143133333 n=1 Tax=Alosa pseudoharengus TaxID=34774 RepID=UPI003F8C665C